MKTLKGNYWNCKKENATFFYKGKYFGKGNRHEIETPGVNPIFINKMRAFSSQHNENGGFYGNIEIDINEIVII